MKLRTLQQHLRQLYTLMLFFCTIFTGPLTAKNSSLVSQASTIILPAMMAAVTGKTLSETSSFPNLIFSGAACAVSTTYTLDALLTATNNTAFSKFSNEQKKALIGLGATAFSTMRLYQDPACANNMAHLLGMIGGALYSYHHSRHIITDKSALKKLTFDVGAGTAAYAGLHYLPSLQNSNTDMLKTTLCGVVILASATHALSLLLQKSFETINPSQSNHEESIKTV